MWIENNLSLLESYLDSNITAEKPYDYLISLSY